MCLGAWLPSSMLVVCRSDYVEVIVDGDGFGVSGLSGDVEVLGKRFEKLENALIYASGINDYGLRIKERTT